MASSSQNPTAPLAPNPRDLSSFSAEEEFSKDYVNAEHIAAFARALNLSDDPVHDTGDSSPLSPRSPPPSDYADGGGAAQTWKYGPDNGALSTKDGEEPRVRKLTATSDFARIRMKVTPRSQPTTSQGWTYHLIRFPMLSVIFLIISFEFGFYVLIRQIVNVFEYVVAWRGKKRKLRNELRQATTYDQWVATARKLDAFLGFDEWKETDEDGYFDYNLVKRLRATLKKLRGAKDTRGLMETLSICVRTNFAGTESVKMYAETFFGTKRLVESYVQEVKSALDYIRTASDVSMEEKRAFFRGVNKNYGSSALCLSGGASFGYYHFGVIKAFLEADLLPRVITGTSAGGLVAALLCTRTNDELRTLLVPELADKISACEDPFNVWLVRWWQTGARFSSVEWAKKAMFFTRGSLTFKEAYERTGRTLNVSVVPADRHSPTILLNHLTAPHCLIWSAILASAAVPGILNPVVLMAKDRTGQVKPHNLGGSRFKDGSLREDIPLGSLHTQFNCNFSIVSQTNPHIHLFFFAPRGSVGRPVAHRKGKGWRGGFILSAMESYIKLDLSKHFKVIRDLDLLPQILQSDWSGVFLQRFSGDLTLTPRSTVSDWFHLLSDPTPPQLERMLSVGQRVSWPALHMVSNRMAIERAISSGRGEVRHKRHGLHREKPTSDTSTPYDSSRHPLPLESDVDAGYIYRSERQQKRAARNTPNAASLFDDAPEGSRAAHAAMRRRRLPAKPSPVREGVTFPTKEAGEISSTQSTPRYSRLGDTIRHVRAGSLGSFSANLGFRSLRGSPNPPSSAQFGGQLKTPEEEPVRRRSNLSITRWFSGEYESSSSGEEEYDNRRSSGSGMDLPPAFGMDEVSDEESDEDASTPRVRAGGLVSEDKSTRTSSPLPLESPGEGPSAVQATDYSGAPGQDVV